MSQNLVIVESPAKARTIQGYLGAKYKVVSSFGHIRDLPTKTLGVDIKHDFKPDYEVPKDKQKVIRDIKKHLSAQTTVWLATDEDREGEAIAWHLVHALKLKADQTKRIAFHEITKGAIASAVSQPRKIDQQRVDAQQARRVLDRLVGYEISPVLWRKVRPGLSAGRVQSVAVRLIVERERKIAAFKSENNFILSAELATKDDHHFSAVLNKNLTSEKEAESALVNLSKAALLVENLEQSDGQRSPAPPFTTSTLQQEAARRLGFSVKQTMRLAQTLYEAGAITYMRTDSVALSHQAQAAAASFIKEHYGADYHQLRSFATKTKGAQEAHEAIRPTRSSQENGSSDARTQRLYELIRGRFLASQMAPAKVKKTIVTISAGQQTLTSQGEVVLFPGWLKAYRHSVIKDREIPPLTVGDHLKLFTAQATETPSRPPARYSEASLVKALEEMGIGRPSTYAPTISTIQDRGYVAKTLPPANYVELSLLTLKHGRVTKSKETKNLAGEGKKLMPTDTATVVTDFLQKSFKDILDYDFTSEVEAEFDRIAQGQRKWNTMIKDFYNDFHKEVKQAQQVSRREVSQARELGKDPSGQLIVARYGRYGPMLQRSGKEEGDKPDFAPLPPDTTIETVTLSQALKMFELPRLLGVEDGQEIKANIGRYGPYVQRGSTFASIPVEQDVFSIDVEGALSLLAAKQKSQAKTLLATLEGGIEVRQGRFGPYVTNGKLNAKVPKDVDPAKLTVKAATDLIKTKESRVKGRS